MAIPHSQLSSMVFGEANANVSYPLQDSFPGGLPVASVNRRTCLGKGGFDPTFGKWLVHPFLGPSNSRTSPTSPRYWTHEISPIPWPQLGCICPTRRMGWLKRYQHRLEKCQFRTTFCLADKTPFPKAANGMPPAPHLHPCAGHLRSKGSDWLGRGCCLREWIYYAWWKLKQW